MKFFNFRVATRPVRGEMAPRDIPSFSSDTLKESFHVSSDYLWNSLPSHLCKITYIPLLKTHLFLPTYGTLSLFFVYFVLFLAFARVARGLCACICVYLAADARRRISVTK